MQIQNIQNNNLQFNGTLIIQNLRKGGRITKRETSKKFDKQLFDIALGKICGGRYRYDEVREVKGTEIREYSDFLKYSKGINLPQTDYIKELAKLNYDDGMYSIEFPRKYRIWHTM